MVKPPYSTLCNCLILLVFDGKSSLHKNSQRTLVELGSFDKVETWIRIAIIWKWFIITRSAEGILRSENKSEKKMLQRKGEPGKRSLNSQDFKQKAMCSNLFHWINNKSSKCSQLPVSLVWRSSICVGCCSWHCIPCKWCYICFHMCPKIFSPSLISPSTCRILMEKLWWIVHHLNCRKMISGAYVCTMKPLWSSALGRNRNWVQALPWFLTCSLGLPASGTDLKSLKGLYWGPSRIHSLTSMVNCGTERVFFGSHIRPSIMVYW